MPRLERTVAIDDVEVRADRTGASADVGLLLTGGARQATAWEPVFTDVLLDAFRIEQAHIVGLSMDGMMTQLFALRHPHRARSLTVMASTFASSRGNDLARIRASGLCSARVG